MKKTRRIFIYCFLAALPVFSVSAQVRVTKPVGEVSTITLSRFKADAGPASAVFRQTLENNLNRSGWFTVAGAGNAEFTVIGEVQVSGADVEVRCEVFNAVTRKREFGKSYSAPSDQARRLAHTVADDIVLAITGKPGIASTRIVVVGNRTGKKELYVCDADGQNLRQITRDGSLNVSPKWTPDAGRIVYTSYRMRFPDVYMLDLRSGKIMCLANYSGLNSSPAMSPDGRSLALILSQVGNPELFLKDMRSGALTRLTRTLDAAESSPSWSPDGQRLVYVSDMSGAPHLYVMDRSSRSSQRLTGSGRENVDPDWGSNGFIVYSSRIGGNYQICVIDPDTMRRQQLTDSPMDHEEPAWAPNGRHIVYSRKRNYRSEIFIIDTMSNVSIPLQLGVGDWHSPDWSPK